MDESHCSIYLPEQMISWNKILHAQNLYHAASEFLLLIQHLSSLLSLFSSILSSIRKKAQLLLDFFDKLKHADISECLSYAENYNVRSSPQKNRATVPGPVWLPMVVPML